MWHPRVQFFLPWMGFSCLTVYILLILSSTPLLWNICWGGVDVQPFVEWGNFMWRSELIYSKDAVNWCDIRKQNDFGIHFEKNQDLSVAVAWTRCYSLSLKGLSGAVHKESEKMCMHGRFVTPRGCWQTLVVGELESLIYRLCVLEKLSSWSVLYVKYTF